LVRQLAGKQAKSMAQGIPQERRIAAGVISSDSIQEPKDLGIGKLLVASRGSATRISLEQ
jgi:hypothetical protein